MWPLPAPHPATQQGPASFPCLPAQRPLQSSVCCAILNINRVHCKKQAPLWKSLLATRTDPPRARSPQGRTETHRGAILLGRPGGIALRLRLGTPGGRKDPGSCPPRQRREPVTASQGGGGMAGCPPSPRPAWRQGCHSWLGRPGLNGIRPGRSLMAFFLLITAFKMYLFCLFILGCVRSSMLRKDVL